MIAVQEVSCGFLLSQAVNTFQKDQGQPKVTAGNDGVYQSENPAWAPDPVLKKPHQSAHKQQVSQHFVLQLYNLGTVFCLDGLLHLFLNLSCIISRHQTHSHQHRNVWPLPSLQAPPLHQLLLPHPFSHWKPRPRHVKSKVLFLSRVYRQSCAF